MTCNDHDLRAPDSGRKRCLSSSSLKPGSKALPSHPPPLDELRGLLRTGHGVARDVGHRVSQAVRHRLPALAPQGRRHLGS